WPCVEPWTYADVRNLRERRHTEQVQRLKHLDQNGTVEGVWPPNSKRVVTNHPAWSRQLRVLSSVHAECGKSYTAVSGPGYQPGPQTGECQRGGRRSEGA